MSMSSNSSPCVVDTEYVVVVSVATDAQKSMRLVHEIAQAVTGKVAVVYYEDGGSVARDIALSIVGCLENGVLACVSAGPALDGVPTFLHVVNTGVTMVTPPSFTGMVLTDTPRETLSVWGALVRRYFSRSIPVVARFAGSGGDVTLTDQWERDWRTGVFLPDAPRTLFLTARSNVGSERTLDVVSHQTRDIRPVLSSFASDFYRPRMCAHRCAKKTHRTHPPSSRAARNK